MCDLLQEAASEHASCLGAGFAELSPLGLAWILTGWRLEVARRPAWREEVVVETWPSARTDRTADRDFLLLSPSGEVLARGTSAWMILDLGRRRPVRLPAVLRDLTLPDVPRALEGGCGRPAWPGGDATSVEVAARRADLDANDHVRNTAYLDWLAEGVPEPLFSRARMRAVEVSFRAEARAGARVVVETVEQAGPGSVVLHQRVVEVTTARELVLARSGFAVRAPGEGAGVQGRC
jgi:medium-chain acyl-[acyl-carrier-protein] hydrolase